MAYLLGVGEEPMWSALLRREERGFGGQAEGAEKSGERGWPI
jgi:hypothetical protein